jgi:phosphodiesterase/alkaline phosphatase D-like protein
MLSLKKQLEIHERRLFVNRKIIIINGLHINLYGIVVACQVLLIFLSVFLAAVPAGAADHQYVKVQGRQLLTDFDKNGVYEPFFIRGPGYNPMPIGRHPSDWGYSAGDPRPANILNDPAILNRDFSKLSAMNANAIRLWAANDVQQGTRFPIKMTNTTLDYARQYNLKVIAGFWISPTGHFQCVNGVSVYVVDNDITSPSARLEIINRFKAFVTAFKDRPEILFWAIGNENNYHLNKNDPAHVRAWYSLINAMAQEARNIEGAAYHPVALVNGDLEHIGNPDVGASDAQLPYIDIWGMNVYRGRSFGDLFVDYKARSTKPLWIAEFGLDAWHVEDAVDPGIGHEDEADQAAWDGELWDEIAGNADIAIGGIVMEYSDEWWKPYEWHCGNDSVACNNTQNYFGTGPQDYCPADGKIDYNPPSNDKYWNAEWWGIMRISRNPLAYQPDIITPRQAYFTLQGKFDPSNNLPLRAYMATPVNGTVIKTTSINFAWSKGRGVSEYWLAVGTTAGAEDIYSSSQGVNTSVTVSGIPLTGQTIHVQLRSKINGSWAGNSFDYTYLTEDKTLPTGSIFINNGDELTSSTLVMLKLFASDNGDPARSVTQMQLSDDGVNWRAPEPYVTSKSWLLPSGQGGKAVYVKFQDNAGNSSRVYSDTITLVGVLPSTTSVTLTLNKDASQPIVFTDAFSITNTSGASTGFQLYNNQDATFTPTNGSPTPIPAQGFGFYEVSGGLGTGQSITIRAYVNNNMSPGLYQGSYMLKELQGSWASQVARITYKLTIVSDSTAPSNLAAQATSVDQVSLTWSDNSSNEQGFQIERSLDGTTFARIATVGVNVVKYANINLTPGIKYYYRVRSYKGTVYSSYTGIASTTTPVFTAPAMRTPIVLGPDQIRLLWDDNTTYETNYRIERSLDGVTFTALATTGANATAYTNTGLIPNTRYYYRVRASKGAINSDFSGVVNATTPGFAAPSALVATAAAPDQIKLTWADNTAYETNYRIERSLDGVTFTPLATTGANVTAYTNTGLIPNTRYYYRVRASKGAINSDFSGAANATTPGFAAPSALVATAAAPDQIKLTWADNTAYETNYRIERSLDGVTFTALVTTGANVTAYTNTGLIPNTRYYYRVRAARGAINSSFSEVAGAATPVLAGPTGLSVSKVSASSARLSWTDNTPYESGYSIERSLNGVTFTQVATVGVNVSTYTNSGLIAGSGYYYRVRAYRGAIRSDYSSTANINM